jgi:N-acetylmuramoyl-L-alanine amidase
MNTTNPFNSPGSLLEQKNKTRARFRLAVYVALGVVVVAIVPMLVQGCKREESNPAPQADTNAPALTADTNAPASTNPPIALPPIGLPAPTNPPTAYTPPAPVAPVAPAPAAVTPAPAAGGQEYVVAHGDSFYTIGKKFGVSIKAVQDANPGVDSKKLKVGQKLSIPAGAAPAASTATATAATADASAAPAASGSATYTVKSGDTLTRIAKTHGTTVKAIKAENSLSTDRIKVGQKLKIPVKETTPATAPAPDALVAPAAAPVSAAPASVPPAPMPVTVPPTTATH